MKNYMKDDPYMQYEEIFSCGICSTQYSDKIEVLKYEYTYDEKED